MKRTIRLLLLILVTVGTFNFMTLDNVRCGNDENVNTTTTCVHDYSWVTDSEGTTKHHICSICGNVDATQYYVTVINGSGSGWYYEGDMAIIKPESDYDITSGWQGKTAEVEGNIRYKVHSWKLLTQWTGNVNTNAGWFTDRISSPKTYTANFNTGTEIVDMQKYTKHTSTKIRYETFLIKGNLWNASSNKSMTLQCTYGKENWISKKLGSTYYTLYYDGANTIRFFKTNRTSGSVKYYKSVSASYMNTELGSATTKLNRKHDVSATISAPSTTMVTYSWDEYQ